MDMYNNSKSHISGRASAWLTYTLSHLAVGFASGFSLFAFFRSQAVNNGRQEVYLLQFLFLALGLQFVFGALCDKFKLCRALSLAGCLLVALGTVLSDLALPASIALIGIGCAAFSSGGGCDSLRHTSGMTGVGIFLSTGVLGYSVGAHFGGGKLPYHSVVAGLLFAGAAVWIYCAEHDFNGRPIKAVAFTSLDIYEGGKKHIPLLKKYPIAVFSGLVTITLYSFGGSIASRPDFNGKYAFLYIPFAIFAGRFAGGLISDLLGARRVGVASLLLSAVLFYMGPEKKLLFLVALFLFNMAMPIILCTFARYLPNHSGLAYGLLSLALLAGAVSASSGVFLSVSAVLSALAALLTAVAVLLISFNEKKIAY